MTSKELIGYLDDMKITGKTASSSLEDVFVQMVRKKLAPVLEERAAELEEKRRAEEEAAAAEEAERAREEELERKRQETERLRAMNATNVNRNTSKKKQQAQQKQQDTERRAAVEREERAARRERLGVTEPEKPASQVGNRRYARGRAYVEDRFVNPDAAEEATRAAAAESEFGESIDTEVAEDEVVETAAPAAVDEGAAPVDESEEEGFVEESFIDEDEDEDQENKR